MKKYLLRFGPSSAVAIELGPVGLMTGWRARIAHVTLIVFAQLLVYDAVKDVLASPR